MSFRARVLLMFCGVLLVSQGIFFVLYDMRSVENANKVVLSNLGTTQRVFERLLDERFERLSEVVHLFSSDFGFRSAIAMAEQDTIYSMLENHSHRVGADMMIVFNTQGEVITTHPLMSGPYAAKAFSSIFSKSNVEEMVGKRFFCMVLLNGVPYQVVLVPVKAPELISYVAVGFELTKDFAQEIKALTNSEVSFLMQDTEKGKLLEDSMSLLLSTNINESSQREFIKELRGSEKKGGDFFSVNLKNEEYITYMLPLFEMKNQRFYATMQTSWEEVLEPYIKHRPVMIMIAGGFLVLSLLMGVVLSRQVTRPVMSLLEAVGKVEKGNYNVTNNLQLEREDEIGMLVVGFNRMVEGLAERDQMKYLALHDGLTGLPNRRQFNDRVDRAIRLHNEKGIKSAVLLIDLDGFKPINDTYGHAAGDAVLKHVGSRLDLSSLREEDIAARLGGDEFAVLYENIPTVEVVKKKAASILKSLNAPMKIEEHELVVGCSIGIAMTRDDIGHSEWLEKADRACYVSKNHGKNAFSFEEEEPVVLANVLETSKSGDKES